MLPSKGEKSLSQARAGSRTDTSPPLQDFERKKERKKTDNPREGCCALVCFSWHLGVLGGATGLRRNVALSYVYANSGCVAARWLCVL